MFFLVNYSIIIDVNSEKEGSLGHLEHGVPGQLETTRDCERCGEEQRRRDAHKNI